MHDPVTKQKLKRSKNRQMTYNNRTQKHDKQQLTYRFFWEKTSKHSTLPIIKASRVLQENIGREESKSNAEKNA